VRGKKQGPGCRARETTAEAARQLARVQEVPLLLSKGKGPVKSAASILDNVHALETANLMQCASPICSNRFKAGGIIGSPKRFCSDQCRQNASIIQRAAKLLKSLTDDEIVRVIRG